MVLVNNPDEAEPRRWVRDHLIAFFAILGVAAGLVIFDSKIAEIIGSDAMPEFRAILLVAVLLTGLGTRAVLAWRSATVDLQGRIFLTLVGLLLLTGAAFGLSDCLQEVRDQVRNANRRARTTSMPHPVRGRTISAVSPERRLADSAQGRSG